MSQSDLPQVVNFLRHDLKLSDDSVQLGLKLSQSDYGSLPMVLWQYGLISLVEFNQIYDWLESYIH